MASMPVVSFDLLSVMPPSLRRRLRDDAGFGLVELLVALVVLTVGVGALMMVFASSIVGLRHSGKEGTAVTIADRLLEQYRAMPFASLPTSLTPPGSLSACPSPSPFPDPTLACQQVSGANSPDHRPYVATTTATSSTITPSGGTAYQQVAITVAVLNSGSEVARETSYFTSLDHRRADTGRTGSAPREHATAPWRCLAVHRALTAPQATAARPIARAAAFAQSASLLLASGQVHA